MAKQNRITPSFTLALLTLPDDEIVLQRRTLDAPYAPGKLGFFGGWVEDGETVEACLLRELREETSLSVETLMPMLITDFVLPAGPDFDRDRHFYLYQIPIDTADFEVYEGDGAETFTINEVKQREDLNGSVKYVFDHFLTDSTPL